MNVSQGKCVLASPDGRFAYDPVNDNCSPVMGRDVSGPTACINSVAHLDQKNAKDGCLYNIRFDPRSIQGEKGLQVLGSIVKTYFANMGEHIQINGRRRRHAACQLRTTPRTTATSSSAWPATSPTSSSWIPMSRKP